MKPKDKIRKGIKLNGVEVPAYVSIYSSRNDYISFFDLKCENFFYAFGQDVAKLQKLYKSPIKTYIHRSGLIYTRILKATVLIRGIESSESCKLRITKWGAEQEYIN